MPFALDPKQTVSFALRSDQDKPADTRPEFEVRFVTVSERMRIQKLIDDAANATEDAECTKILNQAIGTTLVGWRNMRTTNAHIITAFGLPVPYDGSPVDIPFVPGQTDKLLTAAEMWELVYGLLLQTRLAESEKKVSALPATSVTASSATPADTASA